MKILLILPAADHLRITKDTPEVPHRKMLRFSVLSLTTLASLTPEEYSLTICDENVEELDLDQSPDVVGISFMTGLAPRAYELAKHFHNKGAVTVAGGYHPTLRTEEAMTHFDCVVAGPAEQVWPKCLKDIEQGSYQSLYRQTTPYKGSDIPVPKRQLTQKNEKHYITTHAVQTGRGCNHRCKFCSISAFYNQCYYTRPVEDIIEELEAIPKNFMFVDDNIIADKEYARDLFTRMIPLRKRWTGQCSIELADDPELLELASRSGCKALFVGIETPS
ncbi:MAG: B12-binding domain-containing radical SAM protein, partial [Planctomycetes bacterium]|nr:B12-binding domain-containing radical SAM protein [Planctomycetota bacterium]